MPKIDLPQGTVDLLVLRVLSTGELHGWGIAQRLHVVSNQALQLQEGTLYPALYRMERKRWITAEWRQTENNRRAKYYSLTRAGRSRLEEEQQSWDALAQVVANVVKQT